MLQQLIMEIKKRQTSQITNVIGSKFNVISSSNVAPNLSIIIISLSYFDKKSHFDAYNLLNQYKSKAFLLEFY
jgi:hypothetical protein